ncbi:GNAT family N-acetyltransferase [Acidaminococcus sp. LBK-2]|uniref:GNAT family N-acetyltransferase n=1 Tax=Acidaminococcus sp. LBK-2 TaxID=3456956 RepID=UPI003FA49471
MSDFLPCPSRLIGKPDHLGLDLSHFGSLDSCCREKNKIGGFGDLAPSGYLDRLFVHKDYQRRGFATAITWRILQKIRS